MRERRGDHRGSTTRDARDGRDGRDGQPQVSAPPLTVSRCQNETISDIIAGVYIPASMNHGKVVYKKQERSRGLDVLIYYWDDRDGPELCGWWFGPNVGGDQVWAYHPSRTASTPPASEWNVPHDGPIDPSFSVSMRAASVPSGEKASPGHYKKAPHESSRGRNREEVPPYQRHDPRGSHERGLPPAESESQSASSPAPEPPEPSVAPSRDARDARDAPQAYFLNAYNRRRQERARQEQERHNDRKDEGNNEPPPVRRTDEPLRRRGSDRRERVEAERPVSRRREEPPRQPRHQIPSRQIQDMKEVMDRQAEEERRQVEELKRRADERKKREEEFQRKMQSIMEKTREPVPEKDDRNDRRRRDDREDREDRERSARREPREPREPRSDDRQRERVNDRDRGERLGDRGDRGYRDRNDRAGDHRNDRDRRDHRDQRDQPESRRRRGEAEQEDDRAKRRREDERRRGSADEESRRRDERRRDDERRDERRDRSERRKEDDGERKRREEQERIKREEEKRKKEEDMRRREEELQKKRDEKRRVEEEERKKVDEERRAKLAEERKRDEERRKEEEERNKEEMERRRREEWQRHEEELQRKAEDEKKRAEEEQKRREEEAQVLRQQQATLSVLRVLQKLSNASPDDFEALNKELEEVLANELPETGAQQEILKAEADRVLEYAKQYVEQVREQQKKWEELREQQQKKREELEAAARSAVQELQALVTSAEAAAEGAHYTAAPLAGDNEMEIIEVLKLCRKVEKTGRSAMTSCQSCIDLLASKKAVIDEAENIESETSAAVSQVQPRIQAASMLVSDALAKAKDNKDRIAKRIATAKRTEKRAELFAKYDQDGDGLWNRKEIAAYAKGEFDFDMPEENLDRIMRQVCGGKGAAADSMHIVKISVGIARDEVKGLAKREIRLERERVEQEAREQREAELRERRAEFSAECKDLTAELKNLDPDVRAAEGLSEALVQDANSEMREADEANSRLKAIDSIVQSTHATIASIRLKAQALSAKVQEDEQIVELMAKELSALAAKSELQDLLLRKALSSAEQARQLVLNRAFEKYEALRMEVAAKLRVCIEVQGGKPDDLYDTIKTAGSKVSKKTIKVYLQTNQSLIDDERLDTVFPGAPVADEEETEIDREDFMRVVRIYYKVVKEIVLSDNLLIEQSDQLRRMDVGEVMEVFQGPMLDPSVGVYRIHGKAIRDGIVGWATVAGNQGITFLMPDATYARTEMTGS